MIYLEKVLGLQSYYPRKFEPKRKKPGIFQKHFKDNLQLFSFNYFGWIAFIFGWIIFGRVFVMFLMVNGGVIYHPTKGIDIDISAQSINLDEFAKLKAGISIINSKGEVIIDPEEEGFLVLEFDYSGEIFEKFRNDEILRQYCQESRYSPRIWRTMVVRLPVRANYQDYVDTWDLLISNGCYVSQVVFVSTEFTREPKEKLTHNMRLDPTGDP